MAIIEAEKGKQGDIFVNGDLNNKFQPYFREKVQLGGKINWKKRKIK